MYDHLYMQLKFQSKRGRALLHLGFAPLSPVHGTLHGIMLVYGFAAKILTVFPIRSSCSCPLLPYTYP